MTENIIIQETEMTLRTGFCEKCDAQYDELKQCIECGGWFCIECRDSDLCVVLCDDCNYEEDDDE